MAAVIIMAVAAFFGLWRWRVAREKEARRAAALQALRQIVKSGVAYQAPEGDLFPSPELWDASAHASDTDAARAP